MHDLEIPVPDEPHQRKEFPDRPETVIPVNPQIEDRNARIFHQGDESSHLLDTTDLGIERASIDTPQKLNEMSLRTSCAKCSDDI